MKLSTKTLASLLAMTAVAAAIPGVSQITSSKKRRESQFDRLLATHDRRGEIRAEVLGISVQEFKHQRRSMSFDQIIKRYGFYSKRSFRIALFGYLKNELLKRGWTRERIDSYILVRAPRFA